ncbi:dihydrofolate reductase family protein [Labedella endophytica]|uniref:Deaminase n=1 Tax=Labedella endophytica TaxID=1523160 RepID=A0A3S0X4U6_9MICO|nr:dihydrofolate reductase family protein [Labedella endophytica]RUQ98244.1 deaminase [Labedella endophytica]
MGRLLYSTIASLDGYITDADGEFDWAEPDPEVHAFINDLERPVGTYLYGRRTYEVMAYWETAALDPASEPEGPDAERAAVALDYAELWRAAEKVVYSTSLEEVSTARTRLERTFDPDAVRALVAASDTDVGLGGAMLAAEAMRAGLVDEYHVFTFPVIVGGGTPHYPAGVRANLQLLESRTFASGVVYARYAVREVAP